MFDITFELSRNIQLSLDRQISPAPHAKVAIQLDRGRIGAQPLQLHRLSAQEERLHVGTFERVNIVSCMSFVILFITSALSQ